MAKKPKEVSPPAASGDAAKLAQARKTFDLDDPKLPLAIEEAALASGGYPYGKKMKREAFEEELRALQTELAKLQIGIGRTGERIVCLFEGRDSAGKGSCIKYFTEHLNPRQAHVVALSKPSEVERGQWYFQRYLSHLPTAGELVLYDRSWYNRAGVEKVMGFCTPEQHGKFVREAPALEGMLVRDGMRLFKFYLEIGRDMQLMRFHERRHDPLKRWKISDIDLAAMARYDDYSTAKEEMFERTSTAIAPWIVMLANDQRRARLEVIRSVLLAVAYEGKDAKAIGKSDIRIVGSGGDFFVTR